MADTYAPHDATTAPVAADGGQAVAPSPAIVRYVGETAQGTNGPRASLHRGTPGSAGLDIILPKEITINPGYSEVDTGVKVALPEGTWGLLKERSSAFRRELVLGAGVIDSDFRGSVVAMVRNMSDRPVTYAAGEAFCQLLVLPSIPVLVEKHDALDDTTRVGGFGSTDAM
jgi:dUTP pyrophosphatase